MKAHIHQLLAPLFAVCLGSLGSAQTPSIQITSWPAYATNGSITGVVSGVNPLTHKVAVYMYIDGAGWWSKPTAVPPTVPINANGAFSANVTSCCLDDHATIFCALLFQNATSVVAAQGDVRIPSNPNTLAMHCVERTGPTLQFANRTWAIKGTSLLAGPGPNLFSDQPADVSVDLSGRLRLTIHKYGTSWYCTEVTLLESLGHGTYVVQTDSRLDLLDLNITFGAFTWDPFGDDPAIPLFPNREIDIEDSLWGAPPGNVNSQFVVQPYYVFGNQIQYTLPNLAGNSALTRWIMWKPGHVRFAALLGHHLPFARSTPAPFFQHDYASNPGIGHIIPTAGRERFKLNLWLHGSTPHAPANQLPAEVIVTDFKFFPGPARR